VSEYASQRLHRGHSALHRAGRTAANRHRGAFTQQTFGDGAANAACSTCYSQSLPERVPYFDCNVDIGLRVCLWRGMTDHDRCEEPPRTSGNSPRSVALFMKFRGRNAHPDRHKRRWSVLLAEYNRCGMRIGMSSRAVLWAGFGSLLALMALVAVSSNRALNRIEESSRQIRHGFLERDDLLDRLRANFIPVEHRTSRLPAARRPSACRTPARRDSTYGAGRGRRPAAVPQRRPAARSRRSG